jgi:hypothetical protein
MPLECKFQLLTITHNGAKQETGTTMKICCGLISTYNLQVINNDYSDEILKARKAYGDEKKKCETLILANGTNRWTMTDKFPKFDNTSHATLAMERKVLKHFMGKEWRNVDYA